MTMSKHIEHLQVHNTYKILCVSVYSFADKYCFEYTKEYTQTRLPRKADNVITMVHVHVY